MQGPRCCAHGERRLRRVGTGSCHRLVMERGFKGDGPRRTKFFDRSGDERLAVHRDLETGTASGADARGEEVEFAGDLIDGRYVVGRRGDEHGRCGFGKEAKEGMKYYR